MGCGVNRNKVSEVNKFERFEYYIRNFEGGLVLFLLGIERFRDLGVVTDSNYCV